MFVRSFLVLFGIFALSESNVLRDPVALSKAAGQRIGTFNEYYVYTRNNFRTPVQVQSSEESIQASPIVLAYETIIIVHGHQGSAFSSLNGPLKDAFMQLGEFNVIVMDWSIFANQDYNAASLAAPRIATGLVDFINLLVAELRTTLDRVHLVGFGLGAHVVGIAGRNLGGNVARITALDPSGEGWGSTSQRLRSTDAQYVEVIHTDGFGARANGISDELGHVDFYPNGGRHTQPGCSNNACSHARAWELFEASLNSDHLVGSRCNSLTDMSANRCSGPTLVMGGNSFVKYATGIYRLTTGRAFPY